MDGERVFHVVVYKDEPYWIAQCVEVDLAAQASSLEQLKTRFVNTLRAEVIMSRRLNVEAFARLPPAPEKYRELWDQHERQERQGAELRANESSWNGLLSSMGLGDMRTSLAFAS